MPTDADFATIAQAQAYLRGKLRSGGATCPCCKQHVQAHVRRLSPNMITFLLSLYRATGGQVRRSVHHSKLKYVGRDYPYVSAFGLAVPGKSRGTWSLTPEGVRFCQGKESAPREVTIYNGKTIEVGDKRTFVRSYVDAAYKVEPAKRSKAERQLALFADVQSHLDSGSE